MSSPDSSSELAELLRTFGESLRAKLANLRSAAETLDAYPAMEKEKRRRLQGVVLEESQALTAALEEGLGALESWNRSQWARTALPASELLARLKEALPSSTTVAATAVEEGDPEETSYEVEVDLPALSQGLGRLCNDLQEELGVEAVVLRLHQEEGFANLDLLWDRGDMETEQLLSWQSQALAAPSDERGPGIQELSRRHGGEAWFNVSRGTPTAYLRLMLPLAQNS